MKLLIIVFCLSSICISCVQVNISTNEKMSCAEDEVLENGKCAIQANVDCGNTKHGETVSRLRYESSTVAFGLSCIAENQIATCNDGTISSYSGNFTFIDCTVDRPHPIYVTFSAHNEKESYWAEFVDDKNLYLEYRSDLIKRIKLLHSYNVSLNWETDMPVLNAIEKYELDPSFSELSETNGKNILKWMTEDMGMIIDPHIHPDSNYNLADIAYKIDVTMGARVSSVVGGLAVLECSATSSVGYEYFSDWHSAIEANDKGRITAKNSNYVWQAEIIQGGAMAGHARDDSSLGVWQSSLDNFSVADSSSPFIAIGQGYSHSSTFEGESGSKGFYEGIDYIKELLEKVEAGEFADDQILAASIHTRDRKELMSSVNGSPQTINTYDGLIKVLAELEPYVASGQVIIADYEQVANIWKTTYESRPHRYSIDNFSIASFLAEQVANSCQTNPKEDFDCTISQDLNGDGTVDQMESQICDGGGQNPKLPVKTPTQLPAPRGVNVNINQTSGTLSWQAVQGAEKYFILLSASNGYNQAGYFVTTTSTEFTYVIGLDFYFTVYACLNDETVCSSGSPASYLYSTQPPVPTPVPVVVPQNVSVVGFSNYATALGISWYKATGAVSYNVAWSATNGVSTQHGWADSTTNEYVFINKIVGMTTYCVTVYSIGSDSSASSGKTGCITPN